MTNDTVTYYDRLWAVEDQRTAPPDPERVNRVLHAISLHLAHRQSARILDVGCGNGWILEAILKNLPQEADLTGVEPSAVGAKNSKRRAPSANIICGRFPNDVPRRKYDVVVCSEVIEHVHAQEEFLADLADYVAPDGALVLTTPNGRYRTRYFRGREHIAQPLENWLTVKRLKSLLYASFEEVSITTFDGSFFWSIHPLAQRLLNSVVNIKGGWRLTQHIKSVLLDVFFRGLYVIAVATKPRPKNIQASTLRC